MNEELLKNPVVQLMKSVGFDDEYILKGIEDGNIILKSEDKAAKGDHESETKQEEDIDKLEKEAVEKEEKVKKDEKDTAEDKDVEDKDVEDKDVEDKDVMKSLHNDLMKSIGEVFTPFIKSVNASIESMQKQINELGKQTPNFRSEGLNNMNAIQKSLSLEKNEKGKTEINIVTQRPLASKMIEKSLDSAPEDILKSLQEDALAYLTNPEATTVGEELARYMYDKGIQLVK